MKSLAYWPLIPKGHDHFVFSRSNAALLGPALWRSRGAVVRVRGQNGNFVREIVARGLRCLVRGAHSVRIDKNDNIWAIDKGSNMVIRFNPQGRVTWVFGRRQEAADGAGPLDHPDPPRPPVDGNFRQPTDVAWDSQGNTYITDGYVNSRVAKIDKNGDCVKSWGSKGTGTGQFIIPHSIAIDIQDNIYVGDLSNHRIQVFDTDGNFKWMFSIDVPPDPASRSVNGPTPTGERLKEAIGAPNSICITPGPNQALFVGESTYPGRIFKVALDGKVLESLDRLRSGP